VTTVRAGLIGLGVMGRHHLRVLNELSGVEFIGLHDPFVKPSTIPSQYTVHPTIEGLLDATPDYCVVAAPTAFHLELGLRLAERGIHALIEKPVAQNLAEATQLVDAFAAAGLVGAVGHIERFNPALQAMRTKLEEGVLGTIFQITTRRQGPFPARIADVGVVKDLATHDIDLTAWIAGSRYAEVSARTSHRSGRPHEDMVLAVGHLENGIIVNHVVNWLTPFKERNVTVLGENGALVADTLTADLTLYRNGRSEGNWSGISDFRGVSEGDITRFALVKNEPLAVEHQRFRDAVIGRHEEGIVTLRDGLDAVRVADMMIAR